jgi:N-methylhydantoinase A
VGSEADMERLYKAFEREFSEAYSALGLNPEAGVEIEAFVLKARVPQPVTEPRELELGGLDASPARTGSREALFDGAAGRVDTPVYAMPLLRPGNRLAGPALVESDDTTLVVEPGWDLEVDRYGAMALTMRDGEQDDV